MKLKRPYAFRKFASPFIFVGSIEYDGTDGGTGEGIYRAGFNFLNNALGNPLCNLVASGGASWTRFQFGPDGVSYSPATTIFNFSANVLEIRSSFDPGFGSMVFWKVTGNPDSGIFIPQGGVIFPPNGIINESFIVT